MHVMVTIPSCYWFYILANLGKLANSLVPNAFGFS